MKVLIVNNSDISGGAARAAYRLHTALLENSINSKMLVQSKLSSDPKVFTTKSKFIRLLNKLRPYVDSYLIRFMSKDIKSIFSTNLIPFSAVVDQINKLEPDIVHLHWVNAGMLHIDDIKKIKSPIVWSLHDMWAFTGGCHYDDMCNRYEKECGRCPILTSSKENDISKKIWIRKNAVYNDVPDLTVVGLSQWITDCANRSSLFSERNVVNLPNPINSSLFSPLDMRESRLLHNLPCDKKLILFGAMSATSDPRKGFIQLKEALKNLSTDYEVVIFGANRPIEPDGFEQKSHYLGLINDDSSLKALYSAVNVMIVPSLQENLSNAIMESLACGTPVVSFDIGGNSDLIEHKVNGYLAQPYDSNDISIGIDWVLQNENYRSLREASRSKIVNNFDNSIVSKKYISLYKDIINKN